MLQELSVPTPLQDGRRLSEVVEHLPAEDERWWGGERFRKFTGSLSPLHQGRLNSLRQDGITQWRTAYRRTRKGVPVWEIRSDDISGCLRTARGGSSRQAVVEGTCCHGCGKSSARKGCRVNAESIAEVLDADIEQWYEAQRNEGTVNRNVMAVGLIMCEHMSIHFPLDESKWFTGSQVSLLGGARIRNILARHGEERPFASEGGRTSRGSQDLARLFQEVVNGSSAAGEFEDLDEAGKLSIIKQSFYPIILTLEEKIGTARTLAENIGVKERVTVRGIEDFVAGNIDEIARYSEAETRRVMSNLFDAYNRRVAASEPDPSLLVEIPENLAQT